MRVVGRRLVAVLAVIGLVGIIPVMMAQPSGVASAGLSAGFMVPIVSVYHVVLYVAIGLWASWLGREAMVLLPFSCLLLLMFGGMVALPTADRVTYQLWMLGCMLLFALTISVVRQRYFTSSVLVFGALFYVLGVQAMVQLPLIAPPIYFLLGMVLSVALIMAIGVSVGLPLAGWGKSWVKEESFAETPKALTYIPR